MKTTAIFLLVCIPATLAFRASAYPLDAGEETGITRLDGYQLIRSILLERGRLKPGSLLAADDINLRLAGSDFSMPGPDPEFTAQLQTILGSDAPAYGVSLLDLTDPAHPRLAEVNGDRAQNPGSVGKLMVLLGWFQALADQYPDDIAARVNVLLDTQITATDFIIKDSHNVPVWKPGDPIVDSRPIEIGDTANLWSWLDWMASASSNAAASQMIAELMLFREFGPAYPVSAEQARAFFANTPQKELSKKLREAIEAPITRNGLNKGELRQGSFFTRTGKNRVPGNSSYATSSELLHYVTQMDQGKLVDDFSSLEIKKLIYLTDGRVRYGSSPALDDSAIYFKSGSLYSCQPEPGYTCQKYMGNKWNFLSSVTIVDSRESDPPLYYVAVVLSNVLKKNSAEEHRDLATRIHEMLLSQHQKRDD